MVHTDLSKHPLIKSYRERISSFIFYEICLQKGSPHRRALFIWTIFLSYYLVCWLVAQFRPGLCCSSEAFLPQHIPILHPEHVSNAANVQCRRVKCVCVCVPPVHQLSGDPGYDAGLGLSVSFILHTYVSVCVWLRSIWSYCFRFFDSGNV